MDSYERFQELSRQLDEKYKPEKKDVSDFGAFFNDFIKTHSK